MVKMDHKHQERHRKDNNDVQIRSKTKPDEVNSRLKIRSFTPAWIPLMRLLCI